MFFCCVLLSTDVPRPLTEASTARGRKIEQLTLHELTIQKYRNFCLWPSFSIGTKNCGLNLRKLKGFFTMYIEKFNFEAILSF